MKGKYGSSIYMDGKKDVFRKYIKYKKHADYEI